MEGDSGQVLPLELNVRDPWVYPMAVLLVGLLLSFAVTYMATTGSALLILLRGIDTLRQRLVRPWLLPTDDVADWERRLSMLDAQAGQTPQPQAKSVLDAIGNEIDQARIESEVRLKTIRDRQSDLDQVGVMMGEVLAVSALLESPWVKGLRKRLADLAENIQNGRLSRGVAAGQLRQDVEEVDLLVKLGTILPPVVNQADIQALLGNWIGATTSPTDCAPGCADRGAQGQEPVATSGPACGASAACSGGCRT